MLHTIYICTTGWSPTLDMLWLWSIIIMLDEPNASQTNLYIYIYIYIYNLNWKERKYASINTIPRPVSVEHRFQEAIMLMCYKYVWYII